MKKVSEELNHALLRAEQQRHVRRINDIYIEAELSVQGLGKVLESVNLLKKKGQKRFKISAPSINGSERNIYRELDLVRGIIKDRVDSKEYVQSIVFAVALIESYISASLENIIRAYPKKLLISTKGGEVKDGASLPVDVRDVVSAMSLDELIADKARQRVRDAGYAAPEAYFKYCVQVFGFELKEQVRLQYIELKATRDIHVHSDGIANDIYVKKAGKLARAKSGTPLVVDSKYLNASIVCLKQILSDIYRGLKSKYGESPELNRILAASAAAA